MFTLPEIEGAKSNPPALPAPAAALAPPSRFARLLERFFHYTAIVAIDHTHLPPLDRVSGSTGLYRPRSLSRCC